MVLFASDVVSVLELAAEAVGWDWVEAVGVMEGDEEAVILVCIPIGSYLDRCACGNVRTSDEVKCCTSVAVFWSNF